MEEVIFLIFLILSMSYVLKSFFSQIKLPKVLAPIVLGVIFSQYFGTFLNINMDVVDFLASFGAMMLLFYLGLEIDTDIIKKKSKETIGIALSGFFLTFILGFLLSYLILNFGILSSLVVASVLSITAEGIAVILLKENRLLESKFGNIIVSAGVIDDIISVILILALSVFLSFQSLSYSFIMVTLVGIVIISVLFYFLKKTSNIIDSFFIKKSFLSNQSDLLTVSVIFLLTFAVFTKTVNLDFTLGAILGGLILNLSLKRRKVKGVEEEKEITSMISNITFGFLIYFFLFWIGTQFTFDNLGSNLLIGLLFALVAFLGKFIGTHIATRKTNESMKNKFLIGIGLSSKGGVELVIATIALKAGIVSAAIFSSIVTMSIFLTILSPILFNHYVKKKW